MGFVVGFALGLAIGHFGLKTIIEKVKGWFAKSEEPKE